MILLKRKTGYYIKITHEDQYKLFLKNWDISKRDHIDLSSSTMRMKYLMYKLLFAPGYTHLKEMCHELYISRATLNNYIKSVKETLKRYGLEMISIQNAGIKVIGDEEKIRECVFNEILTPDSSDYVVDFTKEEYHVLNGINLDYLREITMRELSKYQVNINDMNLKNLIIHTAIMIIRIKNDASISMHKSNRPNHAMKSLIDDLSSLIEQHYNLILPKSERMYLAMHLLSDTHYEDNSETDETIKALIKVLLKTIYTNTHFDLRNDHILSNDLFTHLKSVFTKHNLHINSHNPLLNTIKANYPLSYDIAPTVTKQCLSKSHFYLNEDEIGFITLYIGASIERCYGGKLLQKYIYLVCGSGNAASRMLEARLKNVFNDKIKITKRLSYQDFRKLKEYDFKHIDFIISTIPISSHYIPVITVDFSLPNDDIALISQLLTIMDLSKSHKIGRFFSPKLFLHAKGKHTKMDMIETLNNKLEQEHIVDDSYLSSVLEREKLTHTNMSRFFALPHSLISNATKTKVAVGICDQPVKWNEKANVRLIFLLAIKKEDYLYLEQLYAFLTRS